MIGNRKKCSEKWEKMDYWSQRKIFEDNRSYEKIKASMRKFLYLRELGKELIEEQFFKAFSQKVRSKLSHTCP